MAPEPSTDKVIEVGPENQGKILVVVNHMLMADPNGCSHLKPNDDIPFPLSSHTLSPNSLDHCDHKYTVLASSGVGGARDKGSLLEQATPWLEGKPFLNLILPATFISIARIRKSHISVSHPTSFHDQPWQIPHQRYQQIQSHQQHCLPIRPEHLPRASQWRWQA